MTVCPSCGVRFHGDLRNGCLECGARAVGDPLVQPDYLLPVYGRALFVGGTSAGLLIIFLGNIVAVLLKATTVSLRFWSIIAAAETAAWRLKWIALPTALLLFWIGKRISSTIRRSPERFAGIQIARGGVTASALMAIMAVVLIGVTIPARLRQHQIAIDAGHEARLYTANRALLEYLRRYETYPASLRDLKDTKRVPDPDGSIAEALAGIDEDSYKPSAEVAFGNGAKSQAVTIRGGVLRRNSLDAKAEPAPSAGVTFTSYELRVPGEEYKTDPKDEWIIRDGVVINPASQSGDQPSQASNRGKQAQ